MWMRLVTLSWIKCHGVDGAGVYPPKVVLALWKHRLCLVAIRNVLPNLWPTPHLLRHPSGVTSKKLSALAGWPPSFESMRIVLGEDSARIGETGTSNGWHLYPGQKT